MLPVSAITAKVAWSKVVRVVFEPVAILVVDCKAPHALRGQIAVNRRGTESAEQTTVYLFVADTEQGTCHAQREIAQPLWFGRSSLPSECLEACLLDASSMAGPEVKRVMVMGGTLHVVNVEGLSCNLPWAEVTGDIAPVVAEPVVNQYLRQVHSKAR